MEASLGEGLHIATTDDAPVQLGIRLRSVQKLGSPPQRSRRNGHNGGERHAGAHGEHDIRDVAKTFHDWQQTQYSKEYENIPEYCHSATLEEIQKKDHSLVPSKYIAFVNRDENIDFDEKMGSIQAELTTLLRDEEQSRQELLNIFKELGYEIKV